MEMLDFIKEPSTQTFDDALDNMSMPSSGVCTMSDLEIMVNQIISTLPKLDRIKIRQEIENMHVETYESPTTFDINKGLALAQAYKDRLTEIYTLALNEYRTRKRCVEMLFDANNLVSKASSSDKRKGEATMKYPIMLFQLEGSETFLKEIEQVMSNIKSISDSISRQGSIIQSQIQLGEYTKRASKIGNNDAEEKLDYHSQVPKVNMDWDDIR